jgi:hypothetical protein
MAMATAMDITGGISAGIAAIIMAGATTTTAIATDAGDRRRLEVGADLELPSPNQPASAAFRTESAWPTASGRFWAHTPTLKCRIRIGSGDFMRSTTYERPPYISNANARSLPPPPYRSKPPSHPDNSSRTSKRPRGRPAARAPSLSVVTSATWSDRLIRYHRFIGHRRSGAYALESSCNLFLPCLALCLRNLLARLVVPPTGSLRLFSGQA